MGGSSGGQTTTQKSEPWEGQKPYTLEGYAEAQNLYNQGPAQYYPGSTVAGFGNETNNALNAITQQGMNGQQQRAGSQNALDQFSGGGLGDWGTVGGLRTLGGSNNWASNPVATRLGDMSMNGTNLAANANSRIGDLAATGGNVAGHSGYKLADLERTGGNVAGHSGYKLGDIERTGGNVAGYSRDTVGDLTSTGGGSNSQIRNDTYDLITGAAQNANPAYSTLGATANGNFVGANPYLDDTYARAAGSMTRQFAEGTSPGIDSAASRAGRYGSGMHANAKDAAGESFGRSLGDLATGIYGGAYGQERGNQLAAANSLGSLYQSGQGLRAQTAGQSASQASEDARLRLAATGQVSGDMAGDLSRRLQATGQVSNDMAGDASRRLAAVGQVSNDMAGDASRRLSASGQLTGAEGQDASNQLAANQQLGSAYESGASRQLDAMNSSNAAYNASRAQQLQGLGMQPAYQQMGYTDLNAASAAGAQRDQLSQQMINDQVARHDFGQNAGWQNLSRYLSSIQGGSPGASVTTTGGGGAYGGLSSLFAGLGGAGQLAMGTRGLLW